MPHAATFTSTSQAMGLASGTSSKASPLMPVGSWMRMAFIASPLSCSSYPSDDTARPDVRRRAGLTIGGGASSETMSAGATKGSRGMTTPSGPGPAQPDPGLAAIISERRQLINVAYRLLGSLAEAEDAVQETYARWYALSRQQQDAGGSPRARP